MHRAAHDLDRMTDLSSESGSSSASQVAVEKGAALEVELPAEGGKLGGTKRPARYKRA